MIRHYGPMLEKIFLNFMRSPVLWTGMVTLLRTGGFFLVLPIVLRRIPSEELGMWYVFLGIATFSGIVELGFAPNISRFASYFLGGAATPRSLGIDHADAEKGEINFAGLAGLAQMARSLYPKIGAAMGLVMTVGGGTWLYFHFGAKFWNLHVAPAYFLYASGMTANMYGLFWMNFLVGVNRVRQGQQIFAVGLVMNYLICAVGLLAGAGLYALALGQIVLALFPRWMACRIVNRDFLSKSSTPLPVSWRDLWPMTWRCGLGGFASWLALPVTTLICAQVVGLADTARYGLSLQLAMMLHGLSSSWLAVTWPRIGVMRTRKEYPQIRRLIAERLSLTLGSYLLGAVVAWWFAPQALHLFKSKTDFLPPMTLARLLGVVCVDLVIGICNAILLSGNHVPNLQASMITGVLAAGFALTLGHAFGIVGIVLAPACAQLLFNLWWTPWLCWRDLHPEIFAKS